jgi:hypothetical protein
MHDWREPSLRLLVLLAAYLDGNAASVRVIVRGTVKLDLFSRAMQQLGRQAVRIVVQNKAVFVKGRIDSGPMGRRVNE